MLSIYTDASFRPSRKNKNGIGYLVLGDDPMKLHAFGTQAIQQTYGTHYLEWRAVHEGLKAALPYYEQHRGPVTLHCDESTIVGSLTSLITPKRSEIKPIYDEIITILKEFDEFHIIHVTHEQNTIADHLADMAGSLTLARSSEITKMINNTFLLDTPKPL